MPRLSSDIREFLRLLQAHDVQFAICGGHAVAFHGYSRLTMDVDILINPTPANASRLMVALQDFGFGNAGIPIEAFQETGTAVSLGVQPNQIDLLTSISSQPTDDIFEHVVHGKLADTSVPVVALGDLLRAKREAGRPKDLADLDELTRLHQPNNDPENPGRQVPPGI